MMHGEAVDYLFGVLESNISNGMPPKEAFMDAVEDMIEVYYHELIQRVKEDKEEKRLIDMTDKELEQACAEAQARLHLSKKVLSQRKTKNDSGGTD